MTKDQYETLNTICSALEVLTYAGEAVSGLAYNMSQTCKILCKMILDFIDDDASRQRSDHVPHSNEDYKE